MAEEQCHFCDILKLHKFERTVQSTNTLISHQNSHGSNKLRKIMKELIFLLGHGEWSTSIPDAVAKLMGRNYPELVNWNGDDKLVIFVPEFYLNSLKAVKYVDPTKGAQKRNYCEEVMESQPDRKADFKRHQNFFIGGMI